MKLYNLTGRYNIARAPLDQARVDGGAWHHSVTRTPKADWTSALEVDALDAIDRYHRVRHWFNWRGEKVSLGGFAYHLAVFPSRRAYLVTHPNMRGAHVAGHNGHLVGIVLVGDFTHTPPTRSHLETAQEVGAWADWEGGRALAWQGHGEWARSIYPTACPGDTAEMWVPALSRREDDMLTQAERNFVTAGNEETRRFVQEVAEVTRAHAVEQGQETRRFVQEVAEVTRTHTVEQATRIIEKLCG